MNQQKMYEEIRQDLDLQFDKECPEDHTIGIIDLSTDSGKNTILNYYEKWYNFWNSKIVHLSDPKMIINKSNILIIMKNTICEQRVLNILKQAENDGLYDQFKIRIMGHH